MKIKRKLQGISDGMPQNTLQNDIGIYKSMQKLAYHGTPGLRISSIRAETSNVKLGSLLQQTIAFH